MFLSLCACFYGFHSDMESGIITWKEICPRPIEMSFKQKIQSMSGSLFQNRTWLLSALTKMWLVEFQLFKKKVLAPFQCFIPISSFYPRFSVLFPIQRFILISVFCPHFSVLSPFQRCIQVVSPFQCFIPISAFYPHFSSVFSFRFSHSFSAFYPDPASASTYKWSTCKWLTCKWSTCIFCEVLICLYCTFTLSLKLGTGNRGTEPGTERGMRKAGTRKAGIFKSRNEAFFYVFANGCCIVYIHGKDLYSFMFISLWSDQRVVCHDVAVTSE